MEEEVEDDNMFVVIIDVMCELYIYVQCQYAKVILIFCIHVWLWIIVAHIAEIRSRSSHDPLISSITRVIFLKYF